MPTNPLIFVVEAEAPLAAMVRYNLEKKGFQVEEEANGKKALAGIVRTKPDLVLLDSMLPGISGIDICRRIRRCVGYSVSIVIAGVHRGDEEVVEALDSGADAYIPKPFEMDLLLARVAALLRRAVMKWPERPIAFVDLTMDLVTHRVQRNGRQVHLSPMQFRLLKTFLEHPHRVFSREELRNALWGWGAPVRPRLVDVYIRRLRRSINAPGEENLVQTSRSAGYALHPDSVHSVRPSPFPQRDC